MDSANNQLDGKIDIAANNLGQQIQEQVRDSKKKIQEVSVLNDAKVKEQFRRSNEIHQKSIDLKVGDLKVKMTNIQRQGEMAEKKSSMDIYKL